MSLAGFGRPIVGTDESVAPADDALLARVALGDQAAFRLLAERHVKRALAIAQRTLGNAADAEEVVQEAMLKVWTHAGEWHPRGARFSTWLYRVVVNLALDRVRRPRAAAGGEAMDHVADPAPGPGDHAEGAEIRRAINAALGEMPERQRMAVVLCYFEDLSCAEAARVMDVSVSTMESLLVRGRRSLRGKLTAAGLALDGGTE